MGDDTHPYALRPVTGRGHGMRPARRRAPRSLRTGSVPPPHRSPRKRWATIWNDRCRTSIPSAARRPGSGPRAPGGAGRSRRPARRSSAAWSVSMQRPTASLRRASLLESGSSLQLGDIHHGGAAHETSSSASTTRRSVQRGDNDGDGAGERPRESEDVAARLTEETRRARREVLGAFRRLWGRTDPTGPPPPPNRPEDPESR